MASDLSFVFSSPAKLNLNLRIVGRRQDGYHLIQSDMILIDLMDEIICHRRNDNDIVRAWRHANVSEAQDLTLQAAHLLRQKSGYYDSGVSITVNKKIPIGKGLGGGSSNAASVLLALNKLWGINWSCESLMDLGATLGADVPFFLFGQAAKAKGIGEKLYPLKSSINNYLLVFPDVFSSTKEAFLEYQKLTNSSKIGRIPPSLSKSENDLTLSVARLHPIIVSAAADLSRVAQQARLSGSGSTVFAAFDSSQKCQVASEQLSIRWSSLPVVKLSTHPTYNHELF